MGTRHPPDVSEHESSGGSADPIRALTYDGERIDAELRFSDGALVATSHRLLAVTPDGDGPNLRTVHRPNVTGVGRARGGRRFLRPLAATAGVGTLALVGGSLFSVESAADTVPTTEGFGGVLGPIRTLLGLVGVVDELLLLVGALLLLVGVGLAGVWLTVRRPVVVVSRAGSEPMRVPADGVTERRLREFARDADVAYDDGVV